MAGCHKYLQFYSFVLLCCVGVVLSSCAGLNRPTILEQAGGVPPRVELETVPFYPQKEYQCGPAALAMALQWSGLPFSPDDLTAEVFTPSRKGSLQAAMMGSARRHGRIAYVSTGLDDMFSEVAAGHPVIILQNLGLSWYPVWHYAVIVGYDLPEKVVLLRSGDIARKRMPFNVFEKTWAHSNYWGLLILRPDQLPVTAKEDLFLSAVLGLEKARQYRAAIKGYQTARSRWPENLSALMGIGNCYYALGEPENAETAYRETIRIHPSAGPAFNNLAQVLFEQGRKQEALAAARKALSFGGPLSAVYQKTLDEIDGLKRE